MRSTPESNGMSYLIQNPKIGWLSPIIKNRLSQEGIDSFDVCSDELPGHPDKYVVWIDEFRREDHHRIRAIFEKSFDVIDNDFNATDYYDPDLEQIRLNVTCNALHSDRFNLQNRILGIVDEDDDSYLWN